MAKNLILLTPLPQFRFTGKGLGRRRFIIDDTMLIQPLGPRLRRAMLNMAEQRQSTDDVRMLVLESELVYLATIPDQWHVRSVDPTEALNYCPVASEMLNRLHDCLLLFAPVPTPVGEPPWFSAEVQEAYDDPWKIEKINVVDLLHPRWTYTHQPSNIDWRSSDVEPVDIDIKHFSDDWCRIPYWFNLRPLSAIDDLFWNVDPSKTGGIFKSADEYAKKRLDEFAKDKWGPDATIRWPSDKDAPRIPTLDLGLKRKPVDLTRRYEQLLSEGHSRALDRAIEKCSGRLHKNPPKNRLARAFEFFCESFRLATPFRFVGFATCLEALLCTARAEITFQLAARLGWLLEPKEYDKRRDIFKEATKLYGLRSAIVHGGFFNVDKITDQEERLVHFCRRAFWQILSNDALFDTFFRKDPKACDAYLESLNLGCPAAGSI